MRIAIAVATIGRAEIVRRTLPAMLAQTRAPDRVVIAAVKPADVEGVAALDPRVETVFSGKGLPVQRNAALDAIGDCDLVVFFDDDFVPAPDFLAETEKLFTSRSDIVAASGETIADGINTAGISADEAYALVADAMTRPNPDTRAPWVINHCYGCNMIARLPAAREVRFDERLPLYAWQEDRDFSVRMRRSGGVIARTPLLRGVHMGVKQARSPGVPLGYSQVANPLYLLNKGTMRPIETAALVGRNIAANLVRQFKPEPWVDRAGRVRGNFMALGDALRGRYTPERILQF